MGKYSRAEIDDLTVLNAYTQYGYGRYKGSDKERYHAIKKVFERINKKFKNCTIGIPMIGAGLAGGDWEIIEKIIKKTNKNNDIILVAWDRS